MRNETRARPRARLVLALVAVAVQAGTTVPSRAGEPGELEAEYRAAAARYERDQDPSAGCTMVSLHRRMRDFAAARTLAEAIRTREAAREREAGDDVPPDPQRVATLAACAYEYGRVLEALGEPRRARDAFEEALSTPIDARRAIVERALAGVLPDATTPSFSFAPAVPAIELRAALRLADTAALRSSLRAAEQAAPVCRPLAAEDVEGAFRTDRFGVRDPDPTTRVFADQGDLLVYTVRGGRPVRAQVCALGLDGNAEVQHAEFIGLGGVRLMIVDVVATASFSCDSDGDDEDASGDEGRCYESTHTVHVLDARGRHVLSLVDASDSDSPSLATVRWESPLTREASTTHAVEPATRTLRFGSRRLRLVRGVLVPAPPATR